MIHKYIKYVMLFVFALVQMQGYANENNKGNYLVTNTFATKYAPTIYKNVNNSETIAFFEDNLAQGYFNIKSEVQVDGVWVQDLSCFNGSFNNVPVRFTLTNISGQAITLRNHSTEGNNLTKLRIQTTNNISLNGFSSGTNIGDGNFYNANNNGLIIENNGTLVISGEINYTGTGNNSSQNIPELVSSVTFRLAKYNTSGALGYYTNTQVDVLQDFYGQISLKRKYNAPGNLNKEIHPQANITLAELTEFEESDLSKYNFYQTVNGVMTQISRNTLINSTYILGKTFSYSRINATCESNKSSIIISVVTNPLPQPGVISANISLVCKGNNSIIISSLQEGVATGPRILRYKFEVSYDGGIRYEPLRNSNGQQFNSLYTNDITISNLNSNVKIRRKVQEEGLAGSRYSYSEPISINIQENTFLINGNENASTRFLVPVGGTFRFPTISTTLPSQIQVFSINDTSYSNPLNLNTPLTLPKGEYYYRVRATTTQAAPVANCVSETILYLSVYDVLDCQDCKEKVFAKSETWATAGIPYVNGFVSGDENAIDEDLSTHSTITVTVGLLGLGTTWQNLMFEELVPAGTPVTIKLGQEYSAAQVAGGITFVGLDSGGNALSTINSAGDGALLDLLVGDNVYEITFVPTNNNGLPVAYQGVRVISGALVAAASNTAVYEAYYFKDSDDPNCNSDAIVVNGAATQAGENTTLTLNETVSDVLWGVKDVGLGVATSLASVAYPYLAVDNNVETYAYFNKAVALLNKQVLNVKFKERARPGDEIRIIMGGFETPVLDLSLLTDFKIQRFLGNEKVGPEISGSQFKILDLNLLALLGSTGNRKLLVVDGINQEFDRVEISYLSTVQVGLLGNYTFIYDVSLQPRMYFDLDSESGKVTDLCATDYLAIQRFDYCTEFEVSFSRVTQYGANLKDANGNDIIENGIILKEILAIEDILNSTIEFSHYDDQTAYFSFNKLYSEYNNDLLVKIQTKRNGQNFGDPQYLRISLTNCEAGMINPVIKSGVKS